MRPAYFHEQMAEHPATFAPQFASLDVEGDLKEAGEEIVSLTRQGLLRVDALLPRFFLPQHSGIRYT